MTTMTITYDRRNKAARAIVETLPKLHSRVGSPVYLTVAMPMCSVWNINMPLRIIREPLSWMPIWPRPISTVAWREWH